MQTASLGTGSAFRATLEDLSSKLPEASRGSSERIIVSCIFN